MNVHRVHRDINNQVFSCAHTLSCYDQGEIKTYNLDIQPVLKQSV